MKIVISRTWDFFNQDIRFHQMVSILKLPEKFSKLTRRPFLKIQGDPKDLQTKKISTDIVFSADIKTGRCDPLSTLLERRVNSNNSKIVDQTGGGLGQTSNFSWDEPDSVSYVYEKFDFWLS